MTSYKIDEVNAACRNLSDVLDVVCELQFGLQVGKKDQRIESLLWIARDLSEGIVAYLEEEDAESLRKFEAGRRASA